MTNLAEGYQAMLDELLNNTLEVTLVPSKDKERARRGLMVRMVTNMNPAWYRDLCRRHPSSRVRNRRKPDTRIKRRNIIRILTRLAAGKTTASPYHRALERYAYLAIPPTDDAPPF